MIKFENIITFIKTQCEMFYPNNIHSSSGLSVLKKNVQTEAFKLSDQKSDKSFECILYFTQSGILQKFASPLTRKWKYAFKKVIWSVFMVHVLKKLYMYISLAICRSNCWENKKWKEILNSDGHQFHRYQQDKQSPLILTTHWTLKNRPQQFIWCWKYMSWLE